jgi:hypothetical protein
MPDLSEKSKRHLAQDKTHGFKIPEAVVGVKIDSAM